MGAKLKKHLAWILSISLILGSGGFGFIGDIISWAEVGVKEQGIVASDSQAYEKTEIEGTEEGADEEARTDVDETGAEAETSEGDKTNEDEAGRDETGGDGTDKGEISKDEELHPYGYATKSDASVQPDHPVSEDKGDSIDGDFSETDIDVADLIDAEEDTYGYEHVTPDGIKILIKVTASDWPEDTQIQVVKVTGQEQERVTELVEDALEKEAVSMVYAYDISFWSKGETFEPEGEVEVTFQFPEEEKERFKGKTEIFHVKDEEDHADIMQKESETELEVSCLADGFSVYGLALYSEDGYIPIYTADDLQNIQNNTSKNYRLMNDIDLGSYEWKPIVSKWDGGTLDGQGYTISNLKLDTADLVDDCIGLFATLKMQYVKDINFSNCSINITSLSRDADVNVGILAGKVAQCHKDPEYSDITIENCLLDVSKKQSSAIGGVIGYVNSTYIKIDRVSSLNNDIKVNNCLGHVGGVIGHSEAMTTIMNSINTSNIQVDAQYPSEIGTSFVTGPAIGGIIGYMSSAIHINQCGNTGEIYVDANKDVYFDIAGILGKGFANSKSNLISDCYNAGSIRCYSEERSNGCRIAGISTAVGMGKMKNCYNIGDIDISFGADSINKIYLLGSYLEEMENCYAGPGMFPLSHISDGATSCALEEMKKQDTFIGFDFGSIWTMGNDEYPYPVLQWQKEGDHGPDAPDIPDENQPLTLISVTPPNNATGVKTTDRIVLEFNKGVYSKYGQDSTIYIKDYDTDEIIYKKTAGYGGVKTLFADNALIGCEAARCYIYILENVFYAKVENEETGETTFEYFKGITDKDEYSFWMESDKLIYRATFDPMGGSEVGARSFQEGSQVKRPNDPIKDGYRFIGWFTDRECTQEFDFATLVYSDIILYAGWTGQDTSSGSGGSGSKVHHEKDTTDDRTASTNYSDDWHRNSNGDWICLDKDKKPLTGYQTGLYWNGIKGNWYFDEGGRMLTGWHEGKYFNENANGCQGAEITDTKILGFIQNGEASGTIGRYSYSLVFVNDIDEWTKVHSSIKNWSKEFQATVVGIWDTVTGKGNGLIQNIADAYMKDPAANKAFLSDIVNEMFSTKTWKQTSEMGGTLNDLVSMGGASDTALNELWDAIENDEQSKIEADGWSEIKRVLNTFDEFQKMQMDYSRNIQYLESLKASVGPQSVLGKAVDDLIDGYKQQTARSFIKITENVLNGFGIDGTATSLMGLLTSDTVFLDIGKKMTDTLLSTSFGTADTLIQAAYTNASNVSAVDKVVYSTYLRSDAIMALRKAEERLASGNGGANAIEEYKNAFECARLMTLAQYKNMLKYYETSSYDKADKRSKIDYLRNEIDKLDVMTFIDYAGWGAETFYK